MSKKRSPRIGSPPSVAEYIAGFPPKVRRQLERLRAIIRQVAPKSDEVISYGIAGFRLNDLALVYIAGFTNHVSLYPAPVRHPDWKEPLAPYAKGAGTAQFALDKPIPVALVKKLVKFLIAQNAARAAARSSKKGAARR